jgi:hypothetical protein
MQCYPVNAKAKKHSFPGSYPAGIIGHFSWPVLPFVSFVNLCALPIRRPIRIHLRPFAPVALGCTWLHLVALQKKFAGSLCCLPVATPIFPKTPEIEVQSHPIEPNMTKFFSIPVFFPPFYRPHTSVHVLVGLMFEVHRCLITERAVDPLPVIGGISFRTPHPVVRFRTAGIVPPMTLVPVIRKLAAVVDVFEAQNSGRPGESCRQWITNDCGASGSRMQMRTVEG